MVNGLDYNIIYNMNIIKLIKNKKIIIGCMIFFIIYLLVIKYYSPNGKNDIKYVHNTLLEILVKTIKVFKKHNMKYWAICGTLLGSIRENKIIDNDDDIDLGLLKDDFLKLQNNENNILNDLRTEGLHLIVSGGLWHNKIVLKNTFNNYEKNRIFIDIMCFEKNKDKYIYSDETSWKEWPDEWFYSKELFPLKKGKLNNITIDIPNNSIKYLERVYGDCKKDKCWKKPTGSPHHLGEINLQSI